MNEDKKNVLEKFDNMDKTEKRGFFADVLENVDLENFNIIKKIAEQHIQTGPPIKWYIIDPNIIGVHSDAMYNEIISLIEDNDSNSFQNNFKSILKDLSDKTSY